MSTFMINLLPDTRQVKQRSHQRRQLVGAVATAICIACGVVLLLLFLSMGSETLIKNSLTNDIAKKRASLEAVPRIIDALTAQQHLDSLPGLFAGRVYLTNFFTSYIAANPTDVAINSLMVNPDNSMVASGFGKSFASVSKLAMALQAQKGVTTSSNGSKAEFSKFTSVEIVSVSRESNNVSFSLNIVMAPGVTSGN